MLTAMKHQGQSLGLAPSRLVDIGVHTVILDTVAYAELCERFNDGVFLHHVPKIDMKNDGSVMETAHIVAADGWEVDRLGRRPARSGRASRTPAARPAATRRPSLAAARAGR